MSPDLIVNFFFVSSLFHSGVICSPRTGGTHWSAFKDFWTISGFFLCCLDIIFGSFSLFFDSAIYGRLRCFVTARCTQCKARYCYRTSSVCVCLPKTLRYRGHICWTSSKLITRIISLGSSLLGATTSAIQTKGNTPKIRGNMGGVALLCRKPAISLKRDKIGPRLLLMTNRHTHYRLAISYSVSKYMRFQSPPQKFQ